MLETDLIQMIKMQAFKSSVYLKMAVAAGGVPDSRLVFAPSNDAFNQQNAQTSEKRYVFRQECVISRQKRHF